MADSRTYNISQATWSCWQTNLVPALVGRGCTNVNFSGGNSGTLSFHHDVPASDGNFKFSYNFGGGGLYVHIDDSPWDIPNDKILDTIGGMIGTCPP